MTDIQILFALIRSSAFNENIDLSDIAFSDESIKKIISIGKRHDLLHLVALGAEKTSLPIGEKQAEELKQAKLKAMFRYAKIDYQIQNICSILENNSIDFVVLKGSVIRNYYPEPWLRTSCDIDILIHKDDIEKATRMLCAGGFKMGTNDYHDVSLMSDDGIHLELHFNIRENIKAMDNVLDGVWDNVIPVEGSKHKNQMTNEYQLFHSVAHMAYHFQSGGCGIRPFIDLELLTKNISVDMSIVNGFLREAGLSEFYKGVLKLNKVWFADADYDGLTASMQEYVINGGVYGSAHQESAVMQSSSKGKKHLLLRRLFPSLDRMKASFPVLIKAPVLLPFCWFMRIVKQLFGHKINKHIAEAKKIGATSKDEIVSIHDMMTSLGIKKEC